MNIKFNWQKPLSRTNEVSLFLSHLFMSTNIQSNKQSGLSSEFWLKYFGDDGLDIVIFECGNLSSSEKKELISKRKNLSTNVLDNFKIVDDKNWFSFTIELQNFNDMPISEQKKVKNNILTLVAGVIDQELVDSIFVGFHLNEFSCNSHIHIFYHSYFYRDISKLFKTWFLQLVF